MMVVAHMGANFFPRGGKEWPKNWNTPQKGFRGGDTFAVLRGAKGGTNDCFKANWEICKNKRERNASVFLQKKGQLFTSKTTKIKRKM